MGIDGDPKTFHDKHLFQVSLDGIGSSDWQKCSELSAELATIEHWEGGALIADKSPGRLTIPDLTLERGSTKNLDTYSWFRETANAAAQAGSISPEFKRDGDIIVLDRDREPIIRWPIVGTWPKKFVAGEWDNTVDEKVLTSLVLVIQYFGDPLVLR